MMIKTVASVAALATAVQGFSSIAVPRPDASKAVKEALEITESFGINSNEAKVAWDIVEEIDASDNSEATKGSLDAECPVQEEVSLECMDYGTFMDQMKVVRDLTSEKNHKANQNGMASVLKNVKLATPQGAVGGSSPELERALLEARTATQEYGITSPEAKLAWETYEDIASSGTQNAMGTNLIDECSVEAGQEACEAMEELERVMPVLLAISDQYNDNQHN
ncbi:expressed unknown protein [Seminavis robusta]|uniref:Uncharacterized protein n=1 Tax=Seminavis robusta TaxID=568900 RepID=A0A9N8DYF8_9STRA|nr:expressed unknown protein [Seminavis robusta]|eukprot:Sro475_g150390.1 n/a (223) ;mRNA; f:24817-25577